MTSLIVSGQQSAPPELRRLVRQTSHVVDELSTTELVTFVSGRGLGVDRLIIWVPPGDADVKDIAMAYVLGADRPADVTVLVVTPSPDEPRELWTFENGRHCFAWPRDRNHLEARLLGDESTQGSVSTPPPR